MSICVFLGSGSHLNARGAYQEALAFTPIESLVACVCCVLPRLLKKMIRYITSTLVCVVVVHSWIALQAHPVPLFQQGHSDLCQSVAGFIKHAHKNCVIGTEVEVVRDATQGPSVVITEPGVAHTVHQIAENHLSCVSTSNFRKSLVQCRCDSHS